MNNDKETCINLRDEMATKKTEWTHRMPFSLPLCIVEMDRVKQNKNGLVCRCDVVGQTCSKE